MFFYKQDVCVLEIISQATQLRGSTSPKLISESHKDQFWAH